MKLFLVSVYEDKRTGQVLGPFRSYEGGMMERQTGLLLEDGAAEVRRVEAANHADARAQVRGTLP